MLLSFLGASLAIIAGYLKYRQEKIVATPYLYEAEQPSGEKHRHLNLEEKMLEPRLQSATHSRTPAAPEKTRTNLPHKESEVVNLKMNL